eukprot:CAMPEP_0201518068 /NCGR_PEP_ID=MMETSP0161_2-20130828/9003_1 /ASSEMBLY_ACC=CAM_ASM_000251 /TAXON_ID=180227 /ORGANISM="Neoparamoeba aestuarina, Strain SoJaBio B1-5/56/2" /LENGTH=133 /DNA_ID=CAMNT_0047915727 /DNA_START=353 /DNA_END=754 /DNA_ORIENTATION=-
MNTFDVIFDLLCFQYFLQPWDHLVKRQGSKPVLCASRLHRRDNLIRIIANDAKSDVCRILFDDSSEGSLGIVRHLIGFVEYNQLIWRLGEDNGCRGKVLDLVTHNIDSTLIAGIEFEDVSLEMVSAVDESGTG